MGMSEERDVVGWEGKYRVSDTGEVRSLPRAGTKGGILSQRYTANGYARVNIGGRSPLVHTLVLEAFVGPRPEGMLARHLNGDQTDNRRENLQWGTPAENMQDRALHGRTFNSNKTHCKHGHPFDESNTHVPQSGSREGVRVCRACDRDKKARKVRA